MLMSFFFEINLHLNQVPFTRRAIFANNRADTRQIRVRHGAVVRDGV
jgi:hypothetical protein